MILKMEDWRQKIGTKGFRPSEYMKARRPYLFSDTEIEARPTLDRSTFEYCLETLTARKQELDFEHFARRLAEKEVCPNLIPQTGPTGGGDSKVDAETYPVSQEISDLWYYADAKGRDGAMARWAFAFSTKEDWRTKVRSDLKGIAGTGRPYSVVYFVTSRFVKDKARADVQDELRTKYGIEVQILDRTWIVEKVFENRHERLATETLKISVPLDRAPKKGPRDTSREADLNELEAQIEDSDRYDGHGYQLVEDALQAALLARGLGLPRVEIDGRFERASRLAEDRGTKQQQLRSAYNRAWTCFWWYDDFDAFNKAYELVEALAQGSSQIADIELLQNLWQLLYSSVMCEEIDAAAGRPVERTALLKGELKRLQEEPGRSSTAAHARTAQLLMRLTEAHDNAEERNKILGEFRQDLELCDGLVDFPAQQFIDILMELGEYFPTDEEFDNTFESLLETARKRESSVLAGRMLLQRGVQKLKGEKPYAAIRLLGRAQQDLALHESRGEMVMALGLCGSAYERVGLLWAARGSVLLAANQAMKAFSEDGEITGQALACLRKLVWVELQLGRIPCALAWIETFLTMNGAANLNEERQTRLAEEWMHIDGALGFLILKASIFDLKRLAAVPNILEALQLEMSKMALLYALGYEDRLRSEGYIPEEEDSAAVAEFFGAWRDQPGLRNLPDPEFLDKQSIELHSGVLGCDISVSAANSGPSLFLGEAVLAGLEAFLATSLDAFLIPLTPRVHLRFVQREFLDEPLDFSVIPGPEAIIEVRHRKDEEFLADPTVTRDKFVALISTITEYIAAPRDEGKEFLEALVGEERGFGRALLASNIKTVIGNILGNEPKLRMSDWKRDGAETELFPLKRGEPWDHDKAGAAEPVETSRPTPGTSEVPAELRDVERMTHRDRRVLSLINVDLWNKAKWMGTGYITSENPAELPFLLLMFDNPEAAVDIFAGWRDSLGPEDAKEQLRVSIVTGVEPKEAVRIQSCGQFECALLDAGERATGIDRVPYQRNVPRELRERRSVSCGLPEEEAIHSGPGPARSRRDSRMGT